MTNVLQDIRVEIGWLGLAATFAILVGLLFLRRLLPADRKKRGRVALVLLAVSLIIRLSAAGLVMTGEMGAANFAAFVAILLMAFGITGVVALAAFDIALARLRIDVPSLFRDILQALAFAVITLIVLRYAGVNPFGLITTSAVLTAIVGLALQSTISNLFAGLSLQAERNVAVGDWLRIGDRIARVSLIKWRSTLLVTRDGDRVIVPNTMLLQNEVINHSRPTREHRVRISVGFHYRHPPNEVKTMLIDCARGARGVLASPAPDAIPTDFADSAVSYALLYWIDDMERAESIEGEVRTRIWYAAQRAGIEIPFPIRTLYMNQVSTDAEEPARERASHARASALGRTDLFRTLEEGDRDLLAASTETVRFAHGEQIIRQGEEGDSLYIIQEGEVSVQLEVDGARRQVAVLRQGQFFGEMSLMTGEPRRATCLAIGDVLCYVVDRDAFQHVLERRPAVAEEVSNVLGERQSALEGERENLSAEARARRAAENSSRLLLRIRDFFNLG